MTAILFLFFFQGGTFTSGAEERFRDAVGAKLVAVSYDQSQQAGIFYYSYKYTCSPWRNKYYTLRIRLLIAASQAGSRRGGQPGRTPTRCHQSVVYPCKSAPPTSRRLMIPLWRRKQHSRFNLVSQSKRMGEVDAVMFPTRNATQIASNATSSWVTARRTATKSGHCDIGLERRREQVAATGRAW